MLRTVLATRYVTPFREGGSLPGLVEADDLGLYVLKFRGAGQGPLALVAEIVAGEIGRALGLNVPELVLMEVDPALGRERAGLRDPDAAPIECRAEPGARFSSGSVMFDPAAGDRAVSPLASAAVWFDAFTTNVDRTARNPNLLYWHKSLYFIDHGAALYFHHDWKDPAQSAEPAFPPFATTSCCGGQRNCEQADAALRPRLNREVFEGVLENVPDAWLVAGDVAQSPRPARGIRRLPAGAARVRPGVPGGGGPCPNCTRMITPL